MNQKKMLFYCVSLIQLFIILQQSDGFPAACLYAFEGLDASINIYSDVQQGEAVYKFNITENGTLSSRTATMNTNTSLFSLTNNTVLINDCPPAGSRTELELSVSVDGSCNPGYLNISVEAAIPLFDMCTNADVVYAEVDGYIHFMELNLRNDHRCAAFFCYASLKDIEDPFEIIIYQWIIKTNASNTIVLGKIYSVVLACFENSQTWADRHSIEIDISFTNTSTSRCYNYSTSTSTFNSPTTTSLTTTFASSSEDKHVSSPRTSEPTSLSLSTYLTNATILRSSTLTLQMPNNTQQASIFTSSLVPSLPSTSRPTTQTSCCSDNGYGFFQTTENILAVTLASCFGAIGATAAGMYMLWSRACGTFSNNKLHPFGCRK